MHQGQEDSRIPACMDDQEVDYGDDVTVVVEEVEVEDDDDASNAFPYHLKNSTHPTWKKLTWSHCSAADEANPMSTSSKAASPFPYIPADAVG